MIKVLLVEDNPGDVRLIQEMLKDTDKVSLRLDHAESLTQGMEVLQKEDIDLVLLDLGLPESQGLDTLSTFLARAPEIPVVVLTGLAQEETGIQAVSNGAQDYLIKGEVDGPLLFRSINYAMERNRAERQINYLNSLLRSVRAVNQVIAQESDLSALLQKSCESLIDTRGYVDVYIAVRDDESDLLFPAAHAGNNPRETWGVTLKGEGEAPKCIQEALKTRRPLIIQSTKEYCVDCDYCAHTANHQSVVAPCFHEGEILGVLSVCIERDFSLSDEETSLLEEIAGDLALAQAHKRAEKNLQESERKFRTLFNSANDAVFFHDLEGNILEVNRTACERLGYSHDELLKMTIPDLDAPDYAHLARERIRELEKKGDMVFETAHLRHDGKVIPVEAGSRVVEYKKGKAILTVARDITERKQAEEAVAASEEKYRSILNSIEDGYFEVDLSGNFIFFNDSMCRILGYPSAELMGMNNREFMDKANAEKVFQAFNQVFTTGESLKTFDWELIRKDGEKCYVDTSVSLMRDTNGKAIGFRGIARDVTDRINAEAERGKLQAQLNQSQRLESIGRLAGGVAHDFNNLLTTIMGNADMALMDLGKDEPLYKDMEEIKGAGQRAARLIHQLVAFSRRQILKPEILDLNEHLPGLDKMLRRLIGEDIELETILAPDLGRIEADSSQMEQVIMNLAVNARDAMPKGGKLTIETTNVELDETYANRHGRVVTPGPYVMLAVSDTGTGMSPETLAQVFDPFFTTKEEGKGTGLGLSTVYGIVKQSNGYIWVYSEPGEGTTFKIYFPRVEKTILPRQEAKGEPEDLRGTEAVLVVEDEEGVRDIARKILSQSGYTVLEASDGREALRIFEEHKGKVHLLLTDVVMPGISGKDLATELKEQHPGLKVVYMSGYTDNAIHRNGVLEEEVPFIQKPFTLDALARKVREVLDSD